jgi:CO/xanthine dehydrogenase Mo-binding subunit
MSVGQRLPRSDAREKTDGRARYIADLERPGMLHAAVLGSSCAHAVIDGYDLAEALSVPGVRAIVTGEDCPDARMGAFIKDEHAIAKGKVRYNGEPVAAVAADTLAQAQAACRLIQVRYRELAAVLTPMEALAPGAPVLHEDLAKYEKVFDAGSDANLCSRTSYSEGDVEAAWRDCDVVLEDWFEAHAQAHIALEPVGALAEVDANGRVTLWSANQSVFRVQANVCESLALPMSRLRCLTPRIGGAFGNKMEAHVQPVTVMLALKSGQPVRLVLTRPDDFEMVRVRHPARIRVKTGAKRDGTLIAREVEAILDGGAYADDSPGVLSHMLRMCAGPYRFQAVKAHGKVAYTNKLRSGAFRGFGQPQIQFGCEQHIDEIARRLGIDPFELRRRNLKRAGERWFGGQEVRSCGLPECLEAVERASGWRDRPRGGQAGEGRLRGMGMAVTAHISGTLATGAIVRMLEDGSVVLNTGATDIGQGSDTVLGQICAAALMLDPRDIAVAAPDTDGSPYNWGTTASRVTYTTGRSVRAAAGEVERQAKEHAAEMLECSVADLELRPGGAIGIAGVPGQQVTFREISRRAHWRVGGPIIGTHAWVFDKASIDPKRAVAIGNPSKGAGVFSFGALVVEVEVDTVTGKTQVLRAWSAVDVGKAINPTAVEGQIEGAFVQGMGYALVEELVWDGARLANPTMMDYKVPTFRDAPYEIHTMIIEAPEPDAPFGAKGAGEIGINVVAAAIANAVADATGIRFTKLPMSSERVLLAMLSAQGLITGA